MKLIKNCFGGWDSDLKLVGNMKKYNDVSNYLSIVFIDHGKAFDNVYYQVLSTSFFP